MCRDSNAMLSVYPQPNVVDVPVAESHVGTWLRSLPTNTATVGGGTIAGCCTLSPATPVNQLMLTTGSNSNDSKKLSLPPLPPSGPCRTKTLTTFLSPNGDGSTIGNSVSPDITAGVSPSSDVAATSPSPSAYASPKSRVEFAIRQVVQQRKRTAQCEYQPLFEAEME